MSGKGKKKRNSKDSTASSGDSDKRKGKPIKKKSGLTKQSKFGGDIFNEGAMENAYIVCHNVQDVLKVRGFPWPDAAKKKKKGKKK